MGGEFEVIPLSTEGEENLRRGVSASCYVLRTCRQLLTKTRVETGDIMKAQGAEALSGFLKEAETARDILLGCAGDIQLAIDRLEIVGEDMQRGEVVVPFVPR